MTRWWHCECGADNAGPEQVCAACGAGSCPAVHKCACGHPAARHAHDGMWCDHWSGCQCKAYRPAPDHTADTCEYTGWRAADHVAPPDDVSAGNVIILCDGLSQDERDVVGVAARMVRDALLAGVTTYGHLQIDRDDRDWGAEAASEARDLIVYEAIRRVKARRSGQ